MRLPKEEGEGGGKVFTRSAAVAEMVGIVDKSKGAVTKART
jgi:hypothetical protein